MKKILIAMLCAGLLCCFTSCGTNSSAGNSSDDYYDGYCRGYEEAIEDLSSYTDMCFNDLSMEYDVEDALQILRNYADGEPIDEDEVHKAIWAVHRFYYDTMDMIFDLDEYTQ